MKLSTDIIRDRMFDRFKKAIKRFYQKRQDRYFEEFELKLQTGIIDVNASNYKDLCKEEAETFLATAPGEVLKFIKEFVNNESDRLFDAVSNGDIDKEEAEVCFEVLKHILVAGEIDNDQETKLNNTHA